MDIFRNLLYTARRFKTATVLNFVGLTVAFAACYLFLTQVTYNHSYNKGFADYENLYRVEFSSFWNNGRWQSNMSRLIADQIAEMPQVESMGLFQCWTNGWPARKGETDMNFTGQYVNNDALVTMAPRLLDGKLGWEDGDQKGIIIPASVAQTYFGETQVAGRCMWWNTGDSIRVRGVYADFPENSSVGNFIFCNFGEENRDNFGNFNYTCYVRLVQQTDTSGLSRVINNAVLEKLHQSFVEHGGEEEWNRRGLDGKQVLRLTPVTETWFSNVDANNDRGNRAVDLILQLSCLLVLIIATINFLNFMLAEAPMRIKSVNTRRVLGSPVATLRFGLVAEAVVTSLMAFALALIVCWLLSQWPFIGEVTVGSILLQDHPVLLLFLGLAAAVVGIVAGLYPAFYVTSFQPVLVLKGSFGLTPKGRQLRTALLLLQFSITCIMGVYIGILYLQSHYIYHSDYGYSKDEVFVVSLKDLKDKRDAFRSELMAQTGVVNVSFSQNVLGSADEYMAWGRGDEMHSVQFVVLPVDWHYLRTMGIRVVEGRDFNEHDGDCYIINEAARSQWDWVEMDKPLLENDLTVVGVCQNVRFASTRVDNASTPMAFVIFGEKYSGWSNPYNVANVRVAAGVDKLEMRRRIKDICVRMGATQEPMVWFLDQMLEKTYEEEFRFIRQVLIFSLICLVITLIGVFCMTMFETEYRRKEIGIRKVMGSSTQEILMMFCRHYALLLSISFIIAAPIAYYIGQQWLQSFAERTPIYWWLFPLALLAVGVITLTTVIIQSWRTANENPVNSIKTE